MTTIDLIVSMPFPAGTALTLDALDGDGNPVPVERIELETAVGRAVFEQIDDAHRVLSVLIEPGDGAARTHKPFFKPGTTYIENRPYAAPEQVRVFRCTSTHYVPNSSELVAFGFGTTALLVDDPSHVWGAAAIGQEYFGREGNWLVYVGLPGPETDDDSDGFVDCPADCGGCVCAALGSMAPCSHCTSNHRMSR